MEFSYFLLIITFFIACLQCFVPLYGIYRHWPRWVRLATPLALIQCLFLSVVFFSLAFSFFSNDFTLAYVAQNSNSHLPWMYRVCALWGGHEGSLLLWVFILNLWTGAVVLLGRTIELMTLARVLAVLGFVSAGFLIFLVSLSNPFVLASTLLADHQELNPLLQDPGLVFHPPLLYMGYVGFSVSFAFAMAALLSGQLNSSWVAWVRPWTLAAWCFLTAGIVSGSWWAYRVLGWGGWWFWDPVENASLLPWLAGTALIHALLVLEKREIWKAWIILLAILTFSLSLIGTFIVRSGILVSVHAFAVDPWRGVFMLGLLGLLTGIALLLYAIRIKDFKRSSYHFLFLSRETLLLSNNILLSVVIFTIFLGTLYPLIIEVLGLGKLSVGAPYFNTVFTPFAILLLFLMGLASFNADSRSRYFKELKRQAILFIVSVGISSLFLVLFAHKLQWKQLLGLSLALWIILTGLFLLWKARHKRLALKKTLQVKGAMLLAHLGAAVLTIGVILSNGYGLQRDVYMTVGDILTLGKYRFQLKEVYALQGANYSGAEANLQLMGSVPTHLHPQLRYYPVSDITVSKPAIEAGFWYDLYVALAEPVGDGVWALRFYYKPFIRWIWLGGMLMALGGVWAIVRKRVQEKR